MCGIQNNTWNFSHMSLLKHPWTISHAGEQGWKSPNPIQTQESLPRDQVSEVTPFTRPCLTSAGLIRSSFPCSCKSFFSKHSSKWEKIFLCRGETWESCDRSCHDNRLVRLDDIIWSQQKREVQQKLKALSRLAIDGFAFNYGQMDTSKGVQYG